MSPDDMRNTVITELSGRTLIPPDQPFFLQQFNDLELIGKAAVYIFSMKAGLRTAEQAKGLTTDDLRNGLIVANSQHTGVSVPTLQGFDDRELVTTALGWFNTAQLP